MNTPPWFAPPPAATGERSVAIIGAGFAGTAAALALARRGWRVTVVDRHPTPAGGASGNPKAVIMPLPALRPNWRTNFHRRAFECFLQHIAKLREQGFDSGFDACGVLSLIGHDEPWPADPDCQPLTQTEAEAKAGCTLPGPALWLPRAGTQPAAELCRVQLDASGAAFIGERSVTSLERSDQEWLLLDAGGDEISRAAQVVIAGGHEASLLDQSRALPLRPLRGQVTSLPAGAISQQPACAICGDGYVAPLDDGGLVTGATYQPGERNCSPREADRQENLRKLATLMPELKLNGVQATDRASVRAGTPDRLPLVGALPGWQHYLHSYNALHHGQRADRFDAAAYQSGLWVLCGLGSRGGTTAALTAEVLAAQLCGEAVEQQLMLALHPARSLISALKKRPEHRAKNDYFLRVTESFSG